MKCKTYLEVFIMSDLAATNCGCGCENEGGCSSILWLIILLSCCGGCNGGFGFGRGNCGNGYGCESIIIIILLLCCCGNGNSIF